MIQVIDYGLGNVQAFRNVYNRLGIESEIVRDPDELSRASKVILPGVGSFDQAISLLHSSGMKPALEDVVLTRKVPLLGVCVGMQVLSTSSEEGVEQGLGWIKGRVRAFARTPAAAGLPTPHMGWNDVQPVRANPLFSGLEKDARFYFLHSYYFDCEEDRHSSSRARYGLTFTCSVQNEHIFGVQFHPEKSHRWGVTLLKNFAGL